MGRERKEREEINFMISKCVCVLGGRSGSLDLCRYQNLCRDNPSQSISLAIMIPLHTFLWYSNIKVFEKLK